MKYTVEQIIELAREVETEDGIDWAGLPVDKDKIYQIIGSQVYELYNQASGTEDGEALLLATITKLVIENFVLNLQIPGNNLQ